MLLGAVIGVPGIVGEFGEVHDGVVCLMRAKGLEWPEMLRMSRQQTCSCDCTDAATRQTMKQADLGLNLTAKRTRKCQFLDGMNCVVPPADLVGPVTPFAPEGRRGRPPFAVETMLRLRFILEQACAVAEHLEFHDCATQA